jgi:hypothetical protein
MYTVHVITCIINTQQGIPLGRFCARRPAVGPPPPPPLLLLLLLLLLFPTFSQSKPAEREGERSGKGYGRGRGQGAISRPGSVDVLQGARGLFAAVVLRDV